MRTALFSIPFILAIVCTVSAQTAPPLEDQLTTLWKQKNYTELRILIDAKTSATPPDVVALYCAKFFYLFVQPDKAKALSAATKLKAAAEATTDPGFIEFATDELAEVHSLHATEYAQPSPEILTQLHTEFSEKYPNIEIGVRLRRFKNP